jgi:SAM-dependent methyltransferase
LTKRRISCILKQATLLSKKLRKIYFSKKISLDDELLKIVDIKPPENYKGNIQSHDFLKNPAIQNIHIYLIEYFIEFSKQWFKKGDFKVLDWGAGKCQVTYLTKKRKIDITSCDIELNCGGDSTFGQYTPIANYGKINVIPLKHPYLLPFDDETYDVVLSFGVLEHVENDFESLKEIYRILKSNGLFFCFWLPYKYSYKQNLHHLKGNFYHDHLYNKKIVKKILEKSKLTMLDYWFRDLLPKTPFEKKRKMSPYYRFFENLDNFICSLPIIKHLASNIEFVAYKE